MKLGQPELGKRLHPWPGALPSSESSWHCSYPSQIQVLSIQGSGHFHPHGASSPPLLLVTKTKLITSRLILINVIFGCFMSLELKGQHVPLCLHHFSLFIVNWYLDEGPAIVTITYPHSWMLHKRNLHATLTQLVNNLFG